MSLSRQNTLLPITSICIIYLVCLMVTIAQETTTLEDVVTSFPEDETATPSYPEQESPSAVSFVRKCQCLATEYLAEDGQCLQHPPHVDASSLSTDNVIVEDIICPAGMASVTLPQDKKMVLEGGYLYIQNDNIYLYIESYCHEDRLDFNMNLIKEIKTCLPAPTLSKCCPNQTKVVVAVSADGAFSTSCTDQSEVASNISLPFNPPLPIGSIPWEWNITEYQVSPVECLPGYELIKVRTEGSANAALTYGSEGAFLEWMSPNNIGLLKLPPSFCIDVEGNNQDDVQYVSYFCYKDPVRAHNELCENKTCVRKCCPSGQIFNSDLGGCSDWNKTEIWMPVMHNFNSMEVTKRNITVTTVTGFPICPHNAFRLDPTDPFVLMDDGRLKVLSVGLVYPATSYCIDTFADAYNIENSSAVVCFEAPEEDECSWQTILQVVALALSCVFILATLFMYISVTEICRRLASKCVISESIALLLSFLCLIILQVFSSNGTTVFCVATGLLFYYSTLASFFWLNVMCFDMYFTINSMVPVRESGSKMSWFVRYSLYGWGTPLLFLIAVCICDNLPVDIYNEHIIRPNIFVTCHIPNNDYAARWTYVYGIMLLLLVVNIVLFVHVAVVLVRQQRESARMLQGPESQTRQGGGGSANCKAKESALLCLKLFVVMGVTWFTEIISFAEGNKCYVWLATDLINCLRGFFIFLIFVCKRDVLKKFHTQLYLRWRRSQRQSPLKPGHTELVVNTVETERCRPLTS